MRAPHTLIYEYSSGSGESLYQVLQRVQQDQIRRLSNGDYYVDVVLTGDRGIGKTRRVFHVKVF
jgi:hypothetical protein